MLRSRGERLYFTALVVGVLGLSLLGSAALLHGRAFASQVLLRFAWERAIVSGRGVAPWPEADLEVRARLRVPRLGVDQIVLGAAAGHSLAYGPTELRVDGRRGSVRFLVGDSDTYFSFLGDLMPGDTIRIQDIDGGAQYYHVARREVRDRHDLGIVTGPREPVLYLVTSWPSDGAGLPSEERLVITARAAVSVVAWRSAARSLRGRAARE
ncbi:MAG: sortase [Deltaproteobacteria bacterium]